MKENKEQGEEKLMEATYKVYEGIHKYRMLEEWMLETLPPSVLEL